MSNKTVVVLSLGFGAALLASGCTLEEDGSNPFAMEGFGEFGDDTSDGGADEPGDGDGDPTTTGDGDGDPTTTGDGDGDPTTTGDGDGDCAGNGPYMGGWDVGCCQNDVSPGAWSPGQITPGTVLPDWTFTDQFGESVRIYDFCHEAIYFEYVALW